MSEEREKFRKYLRSIGQNAMLQSDHPDDSVGQMIDGFEAVATQILQDVVDLFDTRTDDNPDSTSDEFHADLHACLTIIHYAQGLGIDLGEKDGAS